jgi:hypothetical protein
MSGTRFNLDLSLIFDAGYSQRCYNSNASTGDASDVQRMYGLLPSPLSFMYKELKNCAPYQWLICLQSSLIAA